MSQECTPSHTFKIHMFCSMFIATLWCSCTHSLSVTPIFLLNRSIFPPCLIKLYCRYFLAERFLPFMALLSTYILIFCTFAPDFSHRGARVIRAEIIPIEPDPGNAGEGKIR